MQERNSRGRPKRGSKRRKIYICGTALMDRAITPADALELVQGLCCERWTYEMLSKKLDKSMKDTMQIMNDLLHYGLMKFVGKEDREAVFERSITKCDE